MLTVTVEAQDDFLAKLAGRKRPATSIAELIWNALDADATEVDVTVKTNLLGVAEELAVSDNGTGLAVDEAEVAFGQLGGSWKQRRTTTREIR